jgi:hypothetical protein
MRYPTNAELQARNAYYTRQIRDNEQKAERYRQAIVELGAIVLRIDKNGYQHKALARILSTVDVDKQQLHDHNMQRAQAMAARQAQRTGQVD